MSEFKNVTVIKKANIYFEGRVSSRTVLFANGTKKTLGLMLPGDYEFGTADKEIMEILSGELEVLLPGDNNWQSMKSGDTFAVKAGLKFKLKIQTPVDYCCSYIKN